MISIIDSLKPSYIHDTLFLRALQMIIIPIRWIIKT